MSSLRVYESTLSAGTRDFAWKGNDNTCYGSSLFLRYYPTQRWTSESWNPSLLLHHIHRKRRNDHPENLKLVYKARHIKDDVREW